MDRIQYTLLKGRMKGQAFVTFSKFTVFALFIGTIPTASSALDLLHGFVFKGKPLIVEFQHVQCCANYFRTGKTSQKSAHFTFVLSICLFLKIIYLKIQTII